jgi:hypothetical protein
MNIFRVTLIAAFFAAPFMGFSQNLEQFSAPTQIQSDSLLTCSPDPVREQLTIHYNNQTGQDQVWEIFDQSGRMINNGYYPANASVVQVETGSFHTGEFVFLITDTYAHDRKAIKFFKD